MLHGRCSPIYLKLYPIAPLRLGLVHGGVRSHQNVVLVGFTVYEQRDANACRAAVLHCERVGAALLQAKNVGCRQSQPNFLGNHGGLRHRILKAQRQFVQQHHKLITPKARHGVDLAHTGLEPRNRAHQQVCGKLRPIKHLPCPEVTMSTNLEVLEAEVLQLTPADRSRLFERLIASIDTDSAVQQAWELEADRRESELESGLVAAVPGQQAVARLRARLNQ